MVPEAPLEQTQDGLLPAGEGWFVLNAREAAWRRWEGLGKRPRLEGERPVFPPNHADVASGRLPERVTTRYRDGWLPG